MLKVAIRFFKLVFKLGNIFSNACAQAVGVLLMIKVLLQLQELEVEFEKVKNEKPTIQRYLRSQQAKQSKLAENADDDGQADPTIRVLLCV